MKALLRSVAVALLAISMPFGAYAMSASSNDGYGTQTRQETYGNGAKLGGNIASTSGASVYFQGQVVFNKTLCFSSGALPYSGSNRSSTPKGVGGYVTKITTNLCASGGSKVRIRVAKNLTGLPDPVGSWSAKF